MNKVFFPLRSNAVWFESEQALASLERRIKLALVCFDVVMFQDGGYERVVTANGSYERMEPAGTVAPEERSLFFGQGGQFTLDFRPHDLDGPFIPLVSGQALASYKVDFYPIVKRAGIYGQTEYVRWLPRDVSEAEKEKLKAFSKPDKKDGQLQASIPAERLERGYIIDGYYFDSYMSSMLGMPTSFDARIGGFLELKNQQLFHEFVPDVAPLLYGAALKLQMPDFSALLWLSCHQRDAQHRCRHLPVGRSGWGDDQHCRRAEQRHPPGAELGLLAAVGKPAGKRDEPSCR